MNKEFKGFKDFRETKELHESFISKGINIAKEGIQELKAFFFGLETSMWDKAVKYNKKDLIEVLDGIIELMTKQADSNLLNMMENTRKNIIPLIESGKIKTGKQLVLKWQEEMGIYIIK